MKDKNKVFQNKNDLLISDGFGDDVLVSFTTASSGVSQNEYASFNLAYQVGDNKDDVLSNRKILAAKLQLELENLVFAAQKHGTNLKEVSHKDKGRGSTSFEDGIGFGLSDGVDALYTKEENLALCCFYADCTPIFFKVDNIVGIIHAG